MKLITKIILTSCLYFSFICQSNSANQISHFQEKQTFQIADSRELEEKNRQAFIKELQEKRVGSNYENQKKFGAIDGLKLINGPVPAGNYDNVYIKSNSAGIIADGPVTIKNSVIEAPVCFQTIGQGAIIVNNVLDCDLCVEFQSNVMIGNLLANNKCSGKLSNRPDLF